MAASFTSGAQKSLATANNSEILSVSLDKNIYKKDDPVSINVKNNIKNKAGYHAVFISNIAIE